MNPTEHKSPLYDDLWIQTFSFLDLKAIPTLSTVCKKWKILSEAPLLWKYFVQRDWGNTTCVDIKNKTWKKVYASLVEEEKNWFQRKYHFFEVTKGFSYSDVSKIEFCNDLICIHQDSSPPRVWNYRLNAPQKITPPPSKMAFHKNGYLVLDSENLHRIAFCNHKGEEITNIRSQEGYFFDRRFPMAFLNDDKILAIEKKIPCNEQKQANSLSTPPDFSINVYDLRGSDKPLILTVNKIDIKKYNRKHHHHLITVSWDEEKIAALDSLNQIYVWNWRTKKLLFCLSSKNGEFNELILHRDRLILRNVQGILILNATTKELIGKISFIYQGACVRAYGKKLFITTTAKHLHIYDIITGRLNKVFTFEECLDGRNDKISAIFYKKGTLFVGFKNSTFISLLNLKTNQETFAQGSTDNTGGTKDVIFCDKKLIAVSNDTSFRIWDYSVKAKS